ncbi:MAG: hypothetical protein AAGA20_14490 [Planctomycetota bacterium]
MTASRRLAIALVLSGPTLALAQDPFAPSERWSAAPTAAAWLPESVAFAGDDAFVWTAVRGDSDALLLFDAVDEGQAAPRARVPRLPGEFGTPLVAAGERGDAVFALRQVEAPDAYRRAPIVSALDPRAAAATSWTHDMDVRINGPVRLAADADGSIVVAAAWDDRNARVRIDVLDGTDGALFGRTDLPAIGLSALAVSADGSRIVVVAGLTLYSLDANAGLVGSTPLGVATHALAISADGGTIAHGTFGAVEVLADFPGLGLVPVGTIPGSSDEIPSRIALSSDGTIAAIGWWRYTTGIAARLELYDRLFGFPLAEQRLTEKPGATQNLVSAIAIASDGQRAAFGTWGNGTEAEVFVLGIGVPGPVLVVDTPGSVRGLDLDASGTRVAVASKDVHASTFGSRGEVRLVDTGERPLQLLDTPVLGGELAVAARRPGASIGWFLIGERGDPLQIPGITGALLLERGRIQIHVKTPDASGRIDLSLPIANTPALRGRQLHVQSAFRSPGAFELSGNLVSPFVLD